MKYDKNEIKKEIYEKIIRYPDKMRAFMLEYEYDTYANIAKQEMDSKTLEGIKNAKIILEALEEIMIETGFYENNQNISIPKDHIKMVIIKKQ